MAGDVRSKLSEEAQDALRKILQGKGAVRGRFVVVVAGDDAAWTLVLEARDPEGRVARGQGQKLRAELGSGAKWAAGTVGLRPEHARDPVFVADDGNCPATALREAVCKTLGRQEGLGSLKRAVLVGSAEPAASGTAADPDRTEDAAVFFPDAAEVARSNRDLAERLGTPTPPRTALPAELGRVRAVALDDLLARLAAAEAAIARVHAEVAAADEGQRAALAPLRLPELVAHQRAVDTLHDQLRAALDAGR